jgi:peptidoglycan/LPS O-acetylase OafA/YrhL
MSVVAPASVAHVPLPSGVGSAARIDYVDALRVVLTLLVVGHHAWEPYAFSYTPPEIVLPGPPVAGVWAFLGVNAAFFMGLFFLLAGYFTPGSFDRKGRRWFITDRLVRIGIPILMGLLLIVPLQAWMRMNLSPGMLPIGFWDYYTRGFFGIGAIPAGWPVTEYWPQVNYGHLWFLQHLLIYALLYAAWRVVAPKRRVEVIRPAPPTDAMIFAYAVALAIASMVIRIWYPINDWISFLGLIQMEPAHLPQYASMFVIGLIAYRGRWFETMPARRGYGWLAVGLSLALFLYVMAGLGVIVPGVPTGGTGGIDVQGCIWEAFTATGLCVGLPVAFRELALGAGLVWRTLARNAFAIYVFHFPFVLFVQWSLMVAAFPKWVSLLLAWPLAAILTILFTNYVVLRLPGLRRIF